MEHASTKQSAFKAPLKLPRHLEALVCPFLEGSGQKHSPQHAGQCAKIGQVRVQVMGSFIPNVPWLHILILLQRLSRRAQGLEYN